MSSLSANRRLEAVTGQLVPNHCNGHSPADFFSHITAAPPDEIFKTGIMYRADSDPRKVDLGVGAYRTDEGKPFVLSSVKKAELKVVNDKSLNKEYLGIDGEPTFVKLARVLLFGADSPAIKENRIATCQGISGTGSVRVGAEFIAHYLPKGTHILISKPTWGNHNQIFSHAGAGVPIKLYRYWDAKKRGLDINGLVEDLAAAPEGSVVLLHACAHNPTGVDPTKEEWLKIANVMKKRRLLPFFDSAYQGFASGDLEADAWAIREFVRQGFEMIVAQSFAKNFGIYNERVGTISVVTSSAKQADAVLSQMKIIIRSDYSNPPAYGARVVATILSDPALTAEWKQELVGMANRIKAMRTTLRDELKRLGTPGNWDHIVSQIGMFSFTGLTPAQVEVMIKQHHIYLIGNGRISMPGINTKNVGYIAQAIHNVVTTVKN